jgi:sialic acid synthase SpsE
MRTYIIAEMAWSHNGNFKNAVKILEGVKKSGAEAISIHLTDLESYMTMDYKCLDGKTLSNNTDSIYNYLDKINLTNEEWLEFNKLSMDLDIDLVAMCNDYKSFNFSKKMNIKKYVISAASFLEYDFIKDTVQYNNDIILRIGGATLEELDKVINFILFNNPKAKINLLAGIQLYPTPINQLQIKSIHNLKERYKNRNITIGIADHIDGDNPYAIYLPALALSYGIEIVEKHITTDRKERLEDYEAALGIEQFISFVKFIRIAEEALGDGSLDYIVNDSYERYRKVVRKKIVANKNLSKGSFVNREDLIFKRADFGAQLDKLNSIIGKKLKRNISFNEGVNLEDVE